MRRNRRIFENPVTLAEFEEIQNHRQSATKASERENIARDDQCQAAVWQWLSPFPCDEEQDRHRNTRSICPDPGRWLLDHTNFQKWLNPDFCLSPILWLNGIPGAGTYRPFPKFDRGVNAANRLRRQNNSRISGRGYCQIGQQFEHRVFLLQVW